MIQIENLNVSFFKKNIIKNISHHFSTDEGVCAIIGKNGAGKSTFAKAICQIIKSEGIVRVKDRDLKSAPDSTRARLLSYCEELSAEIQLEVCEVLEYSRVGFSEDKEMLNKLIIDFDLAQLLYQSVSSLSGGERQRLSLACAFYQDSKVIFLDEPTNYLDPKHVDELIIYLKNLKNKKIFIISHDINFLLKVSEDFFALASGEFSFSCLKEELIKKKLLDKIFEKKFHYIVNNEEVYVV